MRSRDRSSDLRREAASDRLPSGGSSASPETRQFRPHAWQLSPLRLLLNLRSMLRVGKPPTVQLADPPRRLLTRPGKELYSS